MLFSILLLIFICLFSILFGAGLLHVIGFRNKKDSSELFSPIVSLSVWSIILGVGVTLKIPVKVIAYPFFILAAIFVIIAFRYVNFRKIFLQFIFPFIATLFATYPHLLHGISQYVGSPNADGWSYIAFGQYIWDYPRCVSGGLAPLFQYSAHLCNTRFIASGLLGLLSPMVGDPGVIQTSVGYFIPWAIFIYASSCWYFIQNQTTVFLKVCYLLLSVASGWLFTIQSANNYDNLLVIGYLPVIAGIIRQVEISQIRWGGALGLILASTVFIFPEMTPFIFVATAILFIDRFFQMKYSAISVLKFVGVFVLVFIGCTFTYLPNWIYFLLAQFQITQAAARPGEGIAHELIDSQHWFKGIWGLGSSDIYFSRLAKYTTYIDLFRDFLAGTFTLLLGVGLSVQLTRKKWGLLATFFLISLVIFYFVVIQKYSYAAYKLIVLVWWLSSYFCLVAVEWLFGSFRITRGKIAVLSFFAVAILSMAIVTGLRLYYFDKNSAVKSITPYKELSAVQKLVGNSPVSIMVSNPVANLWAMYFLRDSHVRFETYTSYPNQTHVLPLMALAEKIASEQVRYVLSDISQQTTPREDIVWQNSIYSLRKMNSEVKGVLVSIENPNGVEEWEGASGMWLGGAPAQIRVILYQKSRIIINFDALIGPGLPENPERNLKVLFDGQTHEITIRENQQIEFSVSGEAGSHLIALEVLEKPTVLSYPNGDTRPLMLGVSGIKIIFN